MCQGPLRYVWVPHFDDNVTEWDIVSRCLQHGVPVRWHYEVTMNVHSRYQSCYDVGCYVDTARRKTPQGTSRQYIKEKTHTLQLLLEETMLLSHLCFWISSFCNCCNMLHCHAWEYIHNKGTTTIWCVTYCINRNHRVNKTIILCFALHALKRDNKHPVPPASRIVTTTNCLVHSLP